MIMCLPHLLVGGGRKEVTQAAGPIQWLLVKRLQTAVPVPWRGDYAAGTSLLGVQWRLEAPCGALPDPICLVSQEMKVTGR